MVVIRHLFMIVVTIFHIAYTKPIPLYSPLLIGRRILVVQVISAVTIPSWSVIVAILPKVSHLVLSRFFPRVASLSHILRCSGCIPEGPSALLAWRLRTTAAISYSLGGLYVTIVGCTNNGMVSTYGDCRL